MVQDPIATDIVVKAFATFIALNFKLPLLQSVRSSKDTSIDEWPSLYFVDTCSISTAKSFSKRISPSLADEYNQWKSASILNRENAN